MFLCLCNALTDAEIVEAIHQGAHRPRDVYALCGCRGQCSCPTASNLRALRTGAVAQSSLPATQDR